MALLRRIVSFYALILPVEPVSSDYLPLYIEAYTFLANYKAKHNVSTFKKEDAEQILLEMCRNTLKNKFVPTKRYIESLTASTLHRPTKKESKKAREQMKKARIVVDFERTDKKDQSAYEGDDEISQFMFNKRKFFNSLGTIRLNEIIKDNNLYVKGAHKRDKIDALCALPNADDIIFHEIYLIKYGSADEFAKTMEDVTKKRHRKKKSS